MSGTPKAEITLGLGDGQTVVPVYEQSVPYLLQRLPEHTFRGFASQADMEAGEFDERAAMAAPSMGQIRQAFKVALDANGLDASGLLGKWVDPTVLRPAITLRVAEWISTTSPSSPSTSGGTTIEPSGTTSPDSIATAVGASPASGR
jgi:hypothetical protein